MRSIVLVLVAALFGVAILSMEAHGANQRAEVAKGRTFRDCAQCPQMVVIPPGSFIMGSPDSDPVSQDPDHPYTPQESPQHQVTIGYSLAVGKYAVTRNEYARFVAETKRADGLRCSSFNGTKIGDTPGLTWRTPGFAQTPRDPAVCMDWDDAQAYVQWLSSKTGRQYRLLSEAEWEYAARAGTTTARWWGDEPSHEQMNYGTDQCCAGFVSGRDKWLYTSPVGSFPANAFGLHDMIGNVFQWTGDCWNASYEGAPIDGSFWQSGDCSKHVRRGGSWHGDPKVVRSAFRNGFVNTFRSGSGGFRVAREL